jgi:hypothetical protein
MMTTRSITTSLAVLALVLLAGCGKEPKTAAPPTPAAAPVAVAPAVASPASAASAPAPEASPGECCSVVPNAAMAGRLGRIVVTYPEGTDAQARIDVSREGKPATNGYGNQAFELLPGSYTVVISGKQVDNVTVQSGHDTKVKVGVLRVTAPGGTRLDVLDKDGKTNLTNAYGSKQFGLPVGTVRLQIAGQSETVTIQEGKITDF